MMHLRPIMALAALCIAEAFTPSGLSYSITNNHVRKTQPHDSTIVFFAEPKKNGGLDTAMRSKLVTESIAPWRTLRLFLYGALGSGAFIGGLINTSGAIAGSNRPEFNLNTEVLRYERQFAGCYAPDIDHSCFCLL